MHNATVFTCEIFTVISFALAMRLGPVFGSVLPGTRSSPDPPPLLAVPGTAGQDAPWVTPCGGEVRQRAPAWSLPSYPITSLSLQSPERCRSVCWGFLFSPTMPRFAFTGLLTAILLLPRTYICICIYICVCVCTCIQTTLGITTLLLVFQKHPR